MSRCRWHRSSARRQNRQQAHFPFVNASSSKGNNFAKCVTSLFVRQFPLFFCSFSRFRFARSRSRHIRATFAPTDILRRIFIFSQVLSSTRACVMWIRAQFLPRKQFYRRFFLLFRNVSSILRQRSSFCQLVCVCVCVCVCVFRHENRLGNFNCILRAGILAPAGAASIPCHFSLSSNFITAKCPTQSLAIHSRRFGSFCSVERNLLPLVPLSAHRFTEYALFILNRHYFY